MCKQWSGAAGHRASRSSSTCRLTTLRSRSSEPFLLVANSVPLGHIKFKLNVRTHGADSHRTTDLGDHAKHYEMAFISYATTDRTEVLKRVQILREFGMRYFQDVLDLEPGQRWAKQLYKHIDECDLFLLFWSSAAKASEWVLKEAEYALNRQRGDPDAPPAIHPVIIEGPPIVPPPRSCSTCISTNR